MSCSVADSSVGEVGDMSDGPGEAVGAAVIVHVLYFDSWWPSLGSWTWTKANFTDFEDRRPAQWEEHFGLVFGVAV